MLRRSSALFASVVLSTLLAAGAAAHAQELTADQIIDGVQKAYAKTENFRAVFQQTLHLRATKRKRPSGGKLFFAKPGKFRFVYTKGDDKKVIVSDGTKVWTYMIDEAKVRVDPFSPKLAASLRFLWGGGDLKAEFNVSEKKDSKLGKDGDHVLELVPKGDEGHYKKLIFVVDPKTFDVKQTVVYDPVGNINYVKFVRVDRNVDIKANTFTFKTPKGAEVTESPELKQ